MSATLARRQDWLLTAITADASPARLGRVLGGAAVPADIGLEVYRHAYRARLRECLADDFSAIQHLLGADAFAALADRYIAAVPPQDSTLNAYGSRFPAWVRTQRVATHVAQLADLEWALVAAIHAAYVPAITRSALAKLPPGGWAAVRLVPVPSLRLVRCTWAVNALYEAYRTGRHVAPKRHAGAVVVVRRASGLRRIELAAAEARLLGRLISGAPLGQALAGVSADQAQSVQVAFAAWLAAGFFSGIT